MPSICSSPARARWVLGIIWAALSLNLYLAVLQYQPNTLTWDQWDFFAPIFNDQSWWHLFTYQHGPHRQGLGFVITSWIVKLSGWDSRVDSLWIASLLSLSGLFALRLKWKLTDTLELRDAWLPIVALSLGQFESLLITPNASHSAFPLVLILGLANLWMVKSPLIRYPGAGCVAFSLTFTGFGLFGGAMATALLGTAVVRSILARAWRECSSAAIGFSIAVAGWLTFCADYVFMPAVDGFQFPWSPVTDYFRFGLLMLAYPAGFTTAGPSSYLAGGLLALTILAVSTLALRRWFFGSPSRSATDVVILLLGSGVLFVCNAAVGRVPLGVTGGMASRYVTLMFPLWLGIYLFSATAQRPIWHWASVLMLWSVALWPLHSLAFRPVALWPGTIGATADQHALFTQFTHGKAAWVDTYLKTGSSEQAQAIAGSCIYPAPAATRLDEKLAYLRQRRLSFFSGAGTAESFLPWLEDARAVWNDEAGGANVAHPLSNLVKLTFVTKKPGFASVVISAHGAGRSAMELEIIVRGSPRKISVSPLPATVAIPIDPGLNYVVFRPTSDQRILDETEASLGPANWSERPAPGAIVLE